MKNEMDVMGMDERQRHYWLRANRLTLIAVGIVWWIVIAVEFVSGRTPILMLALVPIFAIFRFFAYKYYASRG